MHDLWSTIVAPTIDVLRPALVLDIGDDDARVARLCARHVRPWEGRVLSLQPRASSATDVGLSIQALPEVGAMGELPRPDLALLHGETGWRIDSVLGGLAHLAVEADLPLPVVLIHASAPSETRAAVESFIAGRRKTRAVYVTGLGETAIVAALTGEEGAGVDRVGLERLLDELRPSPLGEAQLALLEAERLAQTRRAEQAEIRAREVERSVLEEGVSLAERDRLRARIAELAARPVPADADIPGLAAQEPSQASVRGLLKPSQLLAELNWPGPERELALPIPCDPRQIVSRAAERRIAIVAGSDARALRAKLCSILQWADEPVSISLLLKESGSEIADTASRIARAIPEVRLIDGLAQAGVGAELRGEQDEHQPRLPGHGRSRTVPAVAYLLPGLPPEGSGGSHSLVQEARGLRRLGCEARICIPELSLATVSALYGNDDELFVAYEDPAELPDAVGPASVAIATEHPSLPMLERLVQARPEIAPAYYVQDYEPLFAPPGSGRSDRALLSYNAIDGQVLFAKTHWLCNVVSAFHGTPIVKVAPSLDRDVFHAQARAHTGRVVRVAAMVRPRTPRRRPSATRRVARADSGGAGAGVQVLTFGCDEHTYSQLGDHSDRIEHLGLLTREQVAELMRRCDIFIDASAYQAFGRTVPGNGVRRCAGAARFRRCARVRPTRL